MFNSLWKTPKQLSGFVCCHMSTYQSTVGLSVSSGFWYHLLDCRTAFENKCSDSKHSYSVLSGWLAKEPLEDRLESCSSSLCWPDSSAPFALSPAVLSSRMATWPGLQSPACILSHLVYPLFMCLFKNSHFKQAEQSKSTLSLFASKQYQLLKS